MSKINLNYFFKIKKLVLISAKNKATSKQIKCYVMQNKFFTTRQNIKSSSAIKEKKDKKKTK